MFCRSLFLLAIVLSVLLRYTDSDFPFGTISHMMHDIDQSETMINTDKDITPVVTKPHLLTPQGYVSFLNYKAIWY
jgi:hypothetical protein